jgi:hypothetical protein
MASLQLRLPTGFLLIAKPRSAPPPTFGQNVLSLRRDLEANETSSDTTFLAIEPRHEVVYRVALVPPVEKIGVIVFGPPLAAFPGLRLSALLRGCCRRWRLVLAHEQADRAGKEGPLSRAHLDS